MLDFARALAEASAIAIVCIAIAAEGKTWLAQRALNTLLWSTAGLLAARAILVGWSSATTPRPWDSPAFYTVARSAVVEGSFYDPATLRSVFDSTDGYFPADWLNELGYWYPPPAVLAIYPAGHFSPSTGLIVHLATQGALLVIAIALLARWFPVLEGALAYAAAIVIVLSLQPVVDTLYLGQIAFGSLLSIVVAVRLASDKPSFAGAALGIGTLFKPLVIILALLWAAVGRPRILLGAIIALCASALATAAIFGLDVYSEFVRYGPGDRSPELSLNPVIQSLNGQLRRMANDPPSAPGAVAAILHPATLVASAIILLVTLLVLYRSRKWASETETIGLTLAASLLLYPNTLVSTLSLLAVPLAIAMHAAHENRISIRVVSGLAVGTIVLTSGIVAPFYGLLFFWVFSLFSVLRCRPAADALDPPMDPDTICVTGSVTERLPRRPEAPRDAFIEAPS